MPDTSPLHILVTGAHGLIGRALCDTLTVAGFEVLPAVRNSFDKSSIAVGDISGVTDWTGVLSSRVDAVVHLAAKVHDMNAEDSVSRARYYEVNTEGTLNLARQCAEQGVRRFVFLSTVKVMGEGKSGVYSLDDDPAPQGAYAESKWLAEQGLADIASQTGMEIVVIRPPLVYGPQVRANFISLMKVIDKGLPLPFGAIQNTRSLIYIGNLIDAITACVQHPSAVGKTFFVSDGEDVSTPELARKIASALGKKARLLSVPVSLMQVAGLVMGKKSAVDRVAGSFAIDRSLIRNELGWEPPYSMQYGLDMTARWFLDAKKSGAM